MSKALFTTAYLPPIEYFMTLPAYLEVWIEKYENYQKQSYRNRCRIAGPNGMNELTVPVDKQGNIKVCIKDLRISYVEPWQKLHWRSIQTAYNNSPFFLYYRDELEPFYKRKYEYLLDLNNALLALVINWLKLDVKVKFTEAFVPLSSAADDHRYNIHPKKEPQVLLTQYHQVFIEKFGFLKGLSIIDLIFNEGPGSSKWLKIDEKSLQ